MSKTLVLPGFSAPTPAALQQPSWIPLLNRQQQALVN